MPSWLTVQRQEKSGNSRNPWFNALIFCFLVVQHMPVVLPGRLLILSRRLSLSRLCGKFQK